MLYYDRIDVSEGINVNKTRASRKCYICQIGISYVVVLSFNQMSAIDVMIY